MILNLGYLDHNFNIHEVINTLTNQKLQTSNHSDCKFSAEGILTKDDEIRVKE